MAFNWSEALKWIVPTATAAGLGIYANKKASDEQNKANDLTKEQSDRMWQAYQEERNRRDQMTDSIMPQLSNSMRIPGGLPKLGTSYRTMGDGSGAPAVSTAAPVATPTPAPASASRVLGGIGTAASLATSIPAVSGALTGALGAAGGAVPFIGPALLGGSIIASQIGKGRRAANGWTQGPQGQTQLDKDIGAAQTGEEQKTLLANALVRGQQYAAQGDQQKKVVNQWLRDSVYPYYSHLLPADWKVGMTL
jgi:hypothetical protein